MKRCLYPITHTPGWAGCQMFILNTRTSLCDEHWSLCGVVRILLMLWNKQPHRSMACRSLLQRICHHLTWHCAVVRCSPNSRLLEQASSGVSPWDPSATWGHVAEVESVLHPDHECSELRCHQTHNAVGQGQGLPAPQESLQADLRSLGPRPRVELDISTRLSFQYSGVKL